MNLIWHIFRKDARRLFWPILGLVAAIVMPMVFSLASVTGKASSVPTIVSFLGAAMPPLISYFMVMGLMGEDLIAGRGAFWKTRPIAGSRLLAAKLVGIVLLLWVLPIVVSLPWWLGHGYGLHECGMAAAWMLFVQVLATLPALLVAALSDKFSKFFLISIGGMVLLPLVTVMVLSLLSFAHSFGLGQVEAVPAGVRESRKFVVQVIQFSTGVGVILIQFLTRRNWLSWGLIVAAGLCCLSVLGFWSWDIHREASKKPDPAWLASMTIRVPGAEWSPVSWLSGAHEGIDINYEFNNLPLPYAASVLSAEHLLIWPDRTEARSETTHMEGTLDRVALALATGQGSSPPFQSGMALRVGDFKVAERFNREAPAYRGKIKGKLLKMEKVADLPVVAGAEVNHHGYGLRIESVGGPQRGRVEVILRECAPALLRKDPIGITAIAREPGHVRDAYFIINRHRAGVLTAGPDELAEVYLVATVRRVHPRLSFSVRNAAEMPVGDLSEWLKDAVLVKIVFLEEGTFERTVETPRLEIAAAHTTEPN